jgi:hypothetical protein
MTTTSSRTRTVWSPRRPTTASAVVRSPSSRRSTRRCARTTPSTARRVSDAGVDLQLRLPHVGFHRDVGTFSGHFVSPDGRIISDEEWHANVLDWLPSEADKAHVQSLQVGVTEPGKMAGWVAPPSTGINQKPVDFEYVKL